MTEEAAGDGCSDSELRRSPRLYVFDAFKFFHSFSSGVFSSWLAMQKGRSKKKRDEEMSNDLVFSASPPIGRARAGKRARRQA